MDTINQGRDEQKAFQTSLLRAMEANGAKYAEGLAADQEFKDKFLNVIGAVLLSRN